MANNKGIILLALGALALWAWSKRKPAEAAEAAPAAPPYIPGENPELDAAIAKGIAEAEAAYRKAEAEGTLAEYLPF